MPISIFPETGGMNPNAYTLRFDPSMTAGQLEEGAFNVQSILARQQEMKRQSFLDEIRRQIAPYQIAQAKAESEQIPVQQALQRILLQQKGIFLPNQRPGQPESVVAPPITGPESRYFETSNLPEDAPLINQNISPSQRPIVSPSGVVYDPTTAAVRQQEEAERDANKKLLEKNSEPFTLEAGKVRYGKKNVNGDPEIIAEGPPKEISGKKIETFDTKTGLYGVHEVIPGETLPEGIIPASKAPSDQKLKALSANQVDQIAGFNLLDKKLDDIEKFPKNVRESNVGWMDNITGWVQSATGLGKQSSVERNESFRNAVDALVAEFSFGRGGKSLTVNEKEVLAKYLPQLTNSNAAFEARIKSFRNLIYELKSSKIEALRDSGYNTKDLDANSSSPIKVTSKAEYDKLAPGTIYINPQGDTSIKGE